MALILNMLIFCLISDRGGLYLFVVGGGRQNKYLCVLLFLFPPWNISPFTPVRKQNYNRGGQTFVI